MGGLPAFQKAIADVQKNPGIPVSLYINATLCGRDTEPGKRLGENAALTPPNGKPSIPYPNTFRMCHAYEPWIEHMEATYQRLLRETGARILYVDELPTRQDVIGKSGRSCFSTAHGHPTPSAVNATDIAFMRRLRETVPASVPLYGEYPAFDAIAQYFDACIHYYFIPRANELFCRVFDAEHGNGGGRVALNLYRFMFPVSIGTLHDQQIDGPILFCKIQGRISDNGFAKAADITRITDGFRLAIPPVPEHSHCRS